MSSGTKILFVLIMLICLASIYCINRVSITTMKIASHHLIFQHIYENLLKFVFSFFANPVPYILYWVDKLFLFLVRRHKKIIFQRSSTLQENKICEAWRAGKTDRLIIRNVKGFCFKWTAGALNPIDIANKSSRSTAESHNKSWRKKKKTTNTIRNFHRKFFRFN